MDATTLSYLSDGIPLNIPGDGIEPPAEGSSASSSEAIRNHLYGNGVDIPGVEPDANLMGNFWSGTKQVVSNVAAIPGKAVNAAGSMLKTAITGTAGTAGEAGGRILQPIIDQIKSLLQALTIPLAVVAVIAVVGLVVFLAMRPKVSVG